MLFLLILLGGFFSANAQDLHSFIADARAHHAAFADSIHSQKIVRRATILSEDPPQQILFRKSTQGDLRREETITTLPDSANTKVRIIEIFDGESEWQIHADGVPQKIGGGLPREQAPSVEYWIEPPASSKIVQPDVIHNRPCWMIASEPTYGYPYSYVWLDREYYLMIRAESWDDHHNPTVIENTRLREVLPGFAVPSLTTISKSFHPSMKLELLEFELNIELPDSLFKVASE